MLSVAYTTSSSSDTPSNRRRSSASQTTAAAAATQQQQQQQQPSLLSQEKKQQALTALVASRSMGSGNHQDSDDEASAKPMTPAEAKGDSGGEGKQNKEERGKKEEGSIQEEQEEDAGGWKGSSRSLLYDPSQSPRATLATPFSVSQAVHPGLGNRRTSSHHDHYNLPNEKNSKNNKDSDSHTPSLLPGAYNMIGGSPATYQNDDAFQDDSASLATDTTGFTNPPHQHYDDDGVGPRRAHVETCVQATLVEPEETAGRDAENDGVQQQQMNEKPVLAVAKRDTFQSRIKHHRPTQCIVLFMVVLLLTLGLVLAFLFMERGGSGGGGGADEDDLVYVQVGQDLDGTIDSGGFGSAISMCRTGMRMAVATPDEDGRGIVQVFDAKEDGEELVWEQIGQDIQPTVDEQQQAEVPLLNNTFTGRSKMSVALSPDCSTLAVGSPLAGAIRSGRVDTYFFDGSDWNSSLPLYGGTTGDEFGHSVALSEDGMFLAVGAPGVTIVLDDSGTVLEQAGQVCVLERQEESSMGWKLKDNTIDGRRDREHAGVSVALSHTGRIVAIGTTTLAGMSTKAALVYANFDDIWAEWGSGTTSIHADVYDTAWQVSLSADGLTLVESNYYLDDQGSLASNEENDAIFVIASKYDVANDLWRQMGSNIHASIAGPKSGYIVAVSEDGLRIGMGDAGRLTEEEGVAGHAHLYQFFEDGGGGGVWCQIGPNKDGENPGDMFGFALGMSADGTRMVMGSPQNRYHNWVHGRVQVFDILIDEASVVCE